MTAHPLSEMTDSDDKRWAIESAARTLQELVHITKDPDLMREAKKEVDRLAEEAQLAKKMVDVMVGKSENAAADAVNALSPEFQQK